MPTFRKKMTANKEATENQCQQCPWLARKARTEKRESSAGPLGGSVTLQLRRHRRVRSTRIHHHAELGRLCIHNTVKHDRGNRKTKPCSDLYRVGASQQFH